MGWQGADWLERDQRLDEEAPDEAIRLLKIPSGASVADIGAGSGYMTVRLSAQVGPTGRVYANDVQPQMIEILRRRLDKRKITNVVLVQGEIDDPRLPAATVDLALMVDVYHELSQPQQMLRHIREALKPGGRLVLLEYRKEDPSIPIRLEHKMSVARSEARGRSRGIRVVEGRRIAAVAAHADLHANAVAQVAPQPVRDVLFTEPTFLFLFLPILLGLYFARRAASTARTATGCCSSPAWSSTRPAAARSRG